MREVAGQDDPLPQRVMEVQPLPMVMYHGVSLPCPLSRDRPALKVPDRLVSERRDPPQQVNRVHLLRLPRQIIRDAL